MGALPSVPLETGTAMVGGVEVKIRSLSRAETLHMREIAGTGDSEAYVIARSTGCPDDEAAAWLDATDNDTAKALVEAILAMSGFRRPPVQDGEGAHAG